MQREIGPGWELVHAAKDGDVPALQAALDAGAANLATLIDHDVILELPEYQQQENRLRYYYRPVNLALIRGAAAGHLEIVRRLIAAGAQAQLDHSGLEHALEKAAYGGHTAVVQLLIETFRPTAGWLGVALVAAAGERHHDAARVLLDAGADVDFQEKRGPTALMNAAGVGDATIVRWLLHAGADVDASDYEMHQTALMGAARIGQCDIVRALVAAGADVNERDIHDWTALMHAAYRGHAEVVQLLLDAGADPNVREVTISGRSDSSVHGGPPETARGLADLRWHWRVARMIRDRGGI